MPDDGMVCFLNDRRVVKTGYGSDESTRDIEIERNAYSIFEHAKRPSPHILKCFELDNPRGLVLERRLETVRARLESIREGEFPSNMEARTWAKQAAEGLAFIHDQEIIHADFSCKNMLLTVSNDLKICDFGGSSIKGSISPTLYEEWSRLPIEDGSPPAKIRDIFALGSAIYEMSTKQNPIMTRRRQRSKNYIRRAGFHQWRGSLAWGRLLKTAGSRIIQATTMLSKRLTLNTLSLAVVSRSC
jgi:serine/threonine protein kinase